MISNIVDSILAFKCFDYAPENGEEPLNRKSGNAILINLISREAANASKALRMGRKFLAW